MKVGHPGLWSDGSGRVMAVWGLSASSAEGSPGSRRGRVGPFNRLSAPVRRGAPFWIHLKANVDGCKHSFPPMCSHAGRGFLNVSPELAF